MFNSKRIAALEECNKELSARVSELGYEVRKLKAACTVRVGQDKRLRADYYDPVSYMRADRRPTATAIDLIQQLMERQKLTVEAVPASTATFTLTKS